jgi:hypothetical protein
LHLLQARSYEYPLERRYEVYLSGVASIELQQRAAKTHFFGAAELCLFNVISLACDGDFCHAAMKLIDNRLHVRERTVGSPSLA